MSSSGFILDAKKRLTKRTTIARQPTLRPFRCSKWLYIAIKKLSIPIMPAISGKIKQFSLPINYWICRLHKETTHEKLLLAW